MVAVVVAALVAAATVMAGAAAVAVVVVAVTVVRGTVLRLFRTIGRRARWDSHERDQCARDQQPGGDWKSASEHGLRCFVCCCSACGGGNCMEKRLELRMHPENQAQFPIPIPTSLTAVQKANTPIFPW